MFPNVKAWRGVTDCSDVFSWVQILIRQRRLHLPPWRNRLARSAVNRKVGGSSPPGGAFSFFSLVKRTGRKG